MGVERTITFCEGLPSWESVRERLVAIGEQPIIRMIDGLPAFPDEIPEDSWRELRVSMCSGMITMRRNGTQVTCVTWGNQDGAHQKNWIDLCEAWAKAGGGTVAE